MNLLPCFLHSTVLTLFFFVLVTGEKEIRKTSQQHKDKGNKESIVQWRLALYKDNWKGCSTFYTCAQGTSVLCKKTKKGESRLHLKTIRRSMCLSFPSSISLSAFWCTRSLFESSHDLLPTFFLPFPRKPISSHNSTMLNNWYIPLGEERDAGGFKQTVSGLTSMLSSVVPVFDCNGVCLFNLYHLFNKLMHSLDTMSNLHRNTHIWTMFTLFMSAITIKSPYKWFYSLKGDLSVSIVCFSSGLIYDCPGYWDIIISTESVLHHLESNFYFQTLWHNKLLTFMIRYKMMKILQNMSHVCLKKEAEV